MNNIEGEEPWNDEENEDKKFKIDLERVCLIKIEPLNDEDELNVPIKTEKIKEENNNEDSLPNKEEQIEILLKQEFEDHEFSEISCNLIKENIKIENIDEEIKVVQKDSDKEFNFASKLKQSLKDLIISKQHTKPKKPKHLHCKLCDYLTSNKGSLKRHYLMCHEVPTNQVWYHCTKCSYKTMQRGHLKRHDLVHRQSSEVSFFTCAVCSYKFKQKCTLRRHIKDVHYVNKSKDLSKIINPLDQELFKCPKCSYSTYRKSLLTSHMDKHKDVQYICDICSFSTKYRRNLRVHFETHRESSDLQIYECNICQFKTRMGYCLKRHFLSKKHLAMVGKLNEYCPRSMKIKEDFNQA